MLKRDRIAIVLSLAGVTALAWVYLFRTVAGMPDADTMGVVQMRAWRSVDFLMVLLMWVIMMVGMMVPSAAPVTMVYAAIARKASREGFTVAPTVVFVAGYIAMWTLFSVVATVAQWGLDRAALLSPMMVATSPRLGAGLLIAAGIYQLTPAKAACLTHCRSPAYFISEHWRPGVTGALRMGFEHGAFCLGCCWLVMGLLFVGGVMNLLWVAAIALFVLFEKVIPHAPAIGRVAGGAMILAGFSLLANWTWMGG